MSEINLSEKFPNLRPINGAPGLSTVNGIGMRLFGRRDFDQETQSYVTNHVFSILFIPIIAVGAYRVIDVPGGGWYFLGKVPLSRGARFWNAGFLAAILAAVSLGWWHHHTNTPDYLAGERLETADKLVAEGKAGQAAQIYLEEMRKPTRHAGAAREKLRKLVETPPADAKEAAAVFQIALDLNRQNDHLVPNLYEHVRKYAADQADKSPEGALALLDSVAPLAPNPAELLAEQRQLLERLVAADANNVDFVSRLADIYESIGEIARCEKLLVPLANQLGDRDGAAILGRIYFGKGKLDEAYGMLKHYVDSRLPRLQAAATNYETLIKNLDAQITAELNSGKAPNFDFNAAKSAPKAQQEAMVDEYITRRLKEDAGVAAAKKEFTAHRGVVAAALDLGMIMLQRAQMLQDADARKRELEAAEKTLLSVRNVAGQTADYKLSLGQVYYWLGKAADGKKLFDELLQASKRSTTNLIQVAQILREVGDVSEARKLAEEAWQKESDVKMKQQAAHSRSLMHKDIDDEILWLERSDQQAAHVRATLNSARGHKASRDGNNDEAARYFQTAVDIYQSLPENSATLNNCALALFSLYYATHNKDHFVRGMDKLDRAIAMKPGDSILMHNAAATLFDAALRDLFANKVDFQRLKTQASFDLISFLYRDAAEKEALAEQLRKHPGAIKARSYCEKLMIVAPLRDDAYSMLAGMHGFTRDVEGLRMVWQKLEKTKLDLAQEQQDTLDYYAGKDDPKKIDEWRKSIQRTQAVLDDVRAKGGLTFAIAASRLIAAQTGAAPRGISVDENELVRLAEEAHAAAPSDGTVSLLAGALAFRANRALIKEDPQYAELCKTTARSLGPSLVMNYVLATPGPLCDKLLANADVKRVLALKIEMFKKAPRDSGLATWASLLVSHPKEAAQLGEALAKDEVRSLLRSIGTALSPLSGAIALDAYWEKRLAGKNGEADEVLRTFARRGVPLPVK